MAANLFTESHQFSGDEIAEDMRRHWIEWNFPKQLVPRLNRFPPDTATLPGGIARYLVAHNIPAVLHSFGTLNDLKRSLLSGKSVIPIIGQWTNHQGIKWLPWGHAIVIVGFSANDLLTLDPAEEQIEPSLLHRYRLDTFATYWSSMARLWIQVG